MREAECSVSLILVSRGGDAYVIRTSLFTIYLHTFYRTCISNCCRSCLIHNSICYNKKIRQKKNISALSLEMNFKT